MAARKKKTLPIAAISGWENNDYLPVDEVFDTRVTNCLVRAGVKYVGELRGKTARELLDVRGWGRKAILEVRVALEELELPPLREGSCP